MKYRRIKKRISIALLIAMVLLTAHGVAAQARYVIITDSAGKEHRHELAADGYISTYRSDGSDEVDIFYENGALDSVVTRRPDTTTEAQIDYENGRILDLSVADPDQAGAPDGQVLIERQITFRNGYPVCQ